MGALLERARTLQKKAQQAQAGDFQTFLLSAGLSHWIALTCQVCDTAYRRTQLGEKVANDEKLFSLFEPHTQPNQFGRLALIYEDGAGFISHYHLMDRTAADQDMVVEQTRLAQGRHQDEIEEASFDRGFHSFILGTQRLEEFVVVLF